jgi:hypothetical protein
MAKQTTVTFVDDFDGSEAQGTVQFSFDGNAYEIDLSETNTLSLYEALAPYIEKASKRVGSARSGRKPNRRPTSSVDRERNKCIRAFAQARGIVVNSRGRLSKQLVEAYEAEHGPAPVEVTDAAPVEVTDSAVGSPASGHTTRLLQPEFLNA